MPCAAPLKTVNVAMSIMQMQLIPSPCVDLPLNFNPAKHAHFSYSYMRSLVRRNIIVSLLGAAVRLNNDAAVNFPLTTFLKHYKRFSVAYL